MKATVDPLRKVVGTIFWQPPFCTLLAVGAFSIKSGWLLFPAPFSRHLFQKWLAPFSKVVGTFFKSGWHLFQKWLAPFSKVVGTFFKSGWHLFQKWLAPFSKVVGTFFSTFFPAPFSKVVGTFFGTFFKSGWHLFPAAPFSKVVGTFFSTFFPFFPAPFSRHLF
jgi:hypothetical protein